jgi:ABC-type transport system substrate-binding protein
VNSGFLPAVAESIKSQLELLGINATVTAYEETQEFIGNIVSKRSYDILLYEVELGADPDLLPYYHSTQATASGLNLSNYKNALVDDLLIGARETLDTSLRIKKYESFLNYWVDDVPAIGLYQANMTYIYNKNTRAFGNNVTLVTPLDRFSDVTSYAATKATKNKTP